MSRVRSFFLEEAEACLDTLRAALDGVPDLAKAYRAVRLFRGSAALARFGELSGQALELEEKLRPYRGRSEAGAGRGASEAGEPPAEGVAQQVRSALNQLERGMAAVRSGDMEADPRMEEPMQEQGAEMGVEGSDVVAMETLEYRGEPALERALSLRGALEEAVDSGSDDSGQRTALLDEVFDLIRLGSK